MKHVLLVDNSDSPSIVEQSQQGHDSSCNSLLIVIPSSVKYPIPYTCQLAFCNAGMPGSVPNGCSLSLFCVYVHVCLPGSLSYWVLQPLLSRVFSLCTLG